MQTDVSLVARPAGIHGQTWTTDPDKMPAGAVAGRSGVTIEAEAIIDGEHLLLVVEAASQEAVERFLAFLPGPGYLRIRPACSAEEAVQRGGCGPASSPVPGVIR